MHKYLPLPMNNRIKYRPPHPYLYTEQRTFFPISMDEKVLDYLIYDDDDKNDDDDYSHYDEDGYDDNDCDDNDYDDNDCDDHEGDDVILVEVQHVGSKM
jgi:hypothetical protein